MKTLSNTDKKRLVRAMRLAENSSCKQKHGAIIIRGGATMSVGVNVNKNDPVFVGESTTHISVHAEAAAIRACGSADLSNAIIYVARINNSLSPMMSKPCSKCQILIKNAGIKRVVYTIDSDMIL